MSVIEGMAQWAAWGMLLLLPVVLIAWVAVTGQEEKRRERDYDLPGGV
jgi:hypothetical protein